MFKALRRFIRNIGYYLSGGLISASESMETNPTVMHGGYQDVIDDKRNKAQRLQHAISKVSAIKSKKVAEIKQITDELKGLRDEESGALALGKKREDDLKAQGKTEAEIDADPEWKEWLAAYENALTTADEKDKRIATLEADITDLQKTEDEDLHQLKMLAREVEKLEIEQGEAVADVIASKEIKDIADVHSGLANDGTAETLRQLRSRRVEMKAGAEIARKVAGTDASLQRDKLRRAAQSSVAGQDFRSKMGRTSVQTPVQKTAEAPAAAREREKLPG